MKFYVIIGIWLLLFTPEQLYASCKLEGKIRVVTQNYPPYVYECSNELCGIAYEKVKATLEANNADYEITSLPWKRAVSEVKNGKADAIFTIYKTPERKQFLAYTAHPLVNQVVNIYSMSNKSYLDILNSKMNIGVVNGYSYGSHFDNMKGFLGNRILTVRTPQKLSQLLESDRIQAFVSDAAVQEHYFKSGKIKNPQSKFIQFVPSYIAFSNNENRACLLEIFNNSLKNKSQDQTH